MFLVQSKDAALLSRHKIAIMHRSTFIKDPTTTLHIAVDIGLGWCKVSFDHTQSQGSFSMRFDAYCCIIHVSSCHHRLFGQSSKHMDRFMRFISTLVWLQTCSSWAQHPLQKVTDWFCTWQWQIKRCWLTWRLIIYKMGWEKWDVYF